MAGTPFTAVRVKVRAAGLEKVENNDMMGRMRKTVKNILPQAVAVIYSVMGHVNLRHPVPPEINLKMEADPSLRPGMPCREATSQTIAKNSG